MGFNEIFKFRSSDLLSRTSKSVIPRTSRKPSREKLQPRFTLVDAESQEEIATANTPKQLYAKASRASRDVPVDDMAVLDNKTNAVGFFNDEGEIDWTEGEDDGKLDYMM